MLSLFSLHLCPLSRQKGGRKTNLLFHQHRVRSLSDVSRTTSSFAAPFLSPSDQNNDTVKKFCDVSFPGVQISYEIKCKKGSDNARLVFSSQNSPACEPLLAAHLGEGFFVHY